MHLMREVDPQGVMNRARHRIQRRVYISKVILIIILIHPITDGFIY